MKKFFACFLIVLLLTVPAMAKDVSVTFQWDADQSADGSGWEEVRLFERGESGSYNYETPKQVSPQSYGADNLSTPTQMSITTDYPDGQASTKYWVVRAAAGGLESADSEEVSLTVDLTPLPIPVYTAVYNEGQKSIDFSWPTDADSRITKWTIWHRVAGDPDWIALVEVDASGSTSIPIDTLFPAGEKTTREFTMVAYGSYGLSSGDGAITTITVNRVPPSGVINFKIILTE